MDTDLLHAFRLSPLNHAFEVIDMAVDISIGEESDEVHGSAFFCLFDGFLPGSALEHFSGLDCLGNEFGPLSENTSASHGVVTDFAVAHIGIGGKSDSGSMGFQRCKRKSFHQFMKERSGGIQHCVTFLVFADADAVHDDQNDGAFSSEKFRIAFQCLHKYPPYLNDKLIGFNVHRQRHFCNFTEQEMEMKNKEKTKNRIFSFAFFQRVTILQNPQRTWGISSVG